MIELLCLSYSLIVTTGLSQSSVELKNQNCYEAKQLCHLEGGDWTLSDSPLLNDYLVSQWQMVTQRKRVSIEDVRCESTIPVLAED